MSLHSIAYEKLYSNNRLQRRRGSIKWWLTVAVNAIKNSNNFNDNIGITKSLLKTCIYAIGCSRYFIVENETTNNIHRIRSTIRTTIHFWGSDYSNEYAFHKGLFEI